MPQFLVCIKQDGEGCGYTIGCGMRFDFIEADDLHDAIEKTVWPDGREETSSLEGEMALTTILVIPFENVTSVDVKSMTEKIKQDNAFSAELEVPLFVDSRRENDRDEGRESNLAEGFFKLRVEKTSDDEILY